MILKRHYLHPCPACAPTLDGLHVNPFRFVATAGLRGATILITHASQKSPDINPFIGHTGASEIQLLNILIFKVLRSSQFLDLRATI